MDVADTYYDLGDLKYKVKEYESAISSVQRAYTIYVKYYGVNHEITARAKESLEKYQKHISKWEKFSLSLMRYMSTLRIKQAIRVTPEYIQVELKVYFR